MHRTENVRPKLTPPSLSQPYTMPPVVHQMVVVKLVVSNHEQMLTSMASCVDGNLRKYNERAWSIKHGYTS